MVKKSGWLRMLLFCLFMIPLFFTAACSDPFAQDSHGKSTDRFALAEQYGQLVDVNRSTDCKGTKVTIEKILLDKTHTFMIATVDSPVKGGMDSLTVDLFGDQDQRLGRSGFTQKLPGGKTLLTFNPMEKASAALRLEFFGGPVGYGGNVILQLNDIPWKMVDAKYINEYLYPATVEKEGYRLEVNAIENGLSESSLQYQLNAQGGFDGIEHGWLSGYWHQSYPQILFLSAGGQNLEPHLPYPYQSALSYRGSRDWKACAGRAYFDRLTDNTLQLKLTDIYGCYNLDEIIPLDEIRDKLEINRILPVHNYNIELKSFSRGSDKGTWILTYRVLDLNGRQADGAIDAGIYQKSGNYKMSYPITLDNLVSPAGQDQKLVLSTGRPGPGEADFPEGAAVKITRLGIRQDDAVLNIDLHNVPQPAADRPESKIMTAVREYYATYGQALKSKDLAVMERKYGYLRPTGRQGDGINDWRHNFQAWNSLGVKDYAFTFDDPIIMVNGNTASADIAGQEKIVRSDGDSGSVFNAVFSLALEDEIWKITKVDEVTDAEMGN
ncbi:MAG: hypothetical protein ACYDEJ_15215 [Desulfitobacteriaceae bacterium]